MKSINILFGLLLFPILFLSNIWRYISQYSSHIFTKEAFGRRTILIYQSEVRRFALSILVALFLPFSLHAFPFSSSHSGGNNSNNSSQSSQQSSHECDDSLDTDANHNLPGVTIPDLNGTTNAVTKCIKGTIDNTLEYYKFTVQVNGTLDMNGSSPDHTKHWVRLGSTQNGSDYYDSNYTGTETQSATDINLTAGDTVYLYVSKPFQGDDNNTQYQFNFSFTPTIIENADDICYERVQSSGMMCFDMGICKGGMRCKNTIPLKNDSNETLSNVEVIYDESNLGGTFGDNCGVEPSGSCTTKSNFDMGPAGILGSSTDFIITPDITSETSSNTSVWASNFMSASCLGQNTLYATYVKNGQRYRGVMKRCMAKQTEPAFEESCGIYPSVLTSYDHLTLQKNSILKSCNISYPEGEFTHGSSGTPKCYKDSNKARSCVDRDDDTNNGNCSYAPTPDNTFEHDFIETSDSSSTDNSDRTVTLNDYEYGNISFTRNNQKIYFKPQHSYSGGSNRKFMVLGDITLSRNNQQLTFEEGDYYFRNLDFQKNGVKIQTKGDVKFFISNDFNYAGNGENIVNNTSSLFVYVGHNFTMTSSGGGKNWLGMFVYVKGDATISANSNVTKFYGGITAEGAVNVTGQNASFEYNKNGAANLGFPECGCNIVQFQKDQYDISEDFENPIPATKLVHPVIELPDGPAQRDFNISYTTLDGTAIRGSDYVSKTKTVLIHKGDSNLTLDIEIYNDPEIELDEYFFVQLYDPEPKGRACLNDHNKTKIMILAQTDAPICFTDDFDAGLDDKWRVLKSSGGFTPKIVTVNGDNRLRVTPGEHGISTAVTKDYQFDTTQNLIIVEFDYYAYGGCGSNGSGLGADGADGIVNVLFDSSVGDSPIPGGYGGSLGYAQLEDGNGNYLSDGFEKGWLGLGIDEYGNFANCNEGREGGLPNTSCGTYGTAFNPQYHRNTVSIRGDGSEHDGYQFLQGVELTSMSPAQPKVAKKTGFGADGYHSGRYKMTVDARDKAHLYIRLERDTGSGYETIINQFDAKKAEYGQGETPDFIRYAITGSTGDGCNNHDISWIQMRGNCQAYAVQGIFTTGPFDARDDFRWSGHAPKDIDDHAISTKIAGKPFNLQISSMKDDQSGSEYKPGIKIMYGLYEGTQSLPILASALRDTNFTTHDTFSDEFTKQKAGKFHLRIFYCGDYNATTGVTRLYPLETPGCWDSSLPNPKQENTGAALAEKSASGLHLFFHTSDSFMVRPKDWEISSRSPEVVKAGEDVNISIKALDENGSGTFNFAETAGDTFDILVRDTRAGCAAGGFYDRNLSSGWHFDKERGVAVTEDNSTLPVNIAEYLTTKYDNIGRPIITITDEEDDRPCKETFAAIDCNDKNISGYWNTEAKNADGENDNLIGPTIGSATLHSIVWIPDHFDINATFTNHNLAGFTYLSDDLDMAALLSLEIKAMTEDNSTTTNYTAGCYAKPLDLNISVVYTPDPIDYPNTLKKLLYRIETDSTQVDKGNSSDIYNLKLEDAPEAKIFPSGDHNGTAQLAVKLNLDREFNETINPFDMNISGISVTDDHHGEDIITSDFNSSTITTNATYLYARVKSSQPLYDNITPTTIVTPLSIVLYCDRGLIECNTYNGIDVDAGQTSEYNWYTSTQHDNSGADGELSLLATPKASLSPATPAFSGGKNNADVSVSPVTVTRTNDAPLPLDVNISFGPTTNSWLIYNPNTNSADLDPFYRVRFIGDTGWAGFGDTGHVVDGNVSNHRNRRMSW